MHTDIWLTREPNTEISVDRVSVPHGDVISVKLGKYNGGVSLYLNPATANDLARRLLDALRVDEVIDTDTEAKAVTTHLVTQSLARLAAR